MRNADQEEDSIGLLSWPLTLVAEPAMAASSSVTGATQCKSHYSSSDESIRWLSSVSLWSRVACELEMQIF